MPTFDASLTVPRPLPEVFDFFRDPANLPRVSPPDWHMKLVEGPPRLELGSRITLRGRRWGVPQRVISAVTAFELNVLFTDTQVQGPFGRWAHTHRFEAVPGGTRVSDHIDYEPPGGLLGMVLTAGFLERDLRRIFAYREEKLRELLGGAG